MAWGNKNKHKQARRRTRKYDIRPSITGADVAYPKREEDRWSVTARDSAEPTASTGAVGTYCGITGAIEEIESTWMYDLKMPSSQGGGVVIESTVTLRADITAVV